MIDITVGGEEGRTMRVEGARVVLPGFEWAEVAATPFIDRDYQPTDLWEITDIATGLGVGMCGGHATIEDAIVAVCAHLREVGATEEMYAKAQARARAKYAHLRARSGT